MKVRLAAIVGFPIVAAVVGLAGYRSGLWRFNYPSASEFPIRGIDVSHHQGEIDWARVATEGIRFAYIKATEGGDFRDSRFAENWAGASESAIAVGAYHFYTLCRSGREQAENFMEVVPEDTDALPPAIDFEFVGNCDRRPPPGEVLRELSTFAQLIEQRYGKTPLLYATYDSLDTYHPEDAVRGGLWIRDVFGRPNLPDAVWRIWQFADNTRIRGIDGPVDQNVLNGSEGEFLRVLRE
jgi:lysozyme